MGHHCPDTSQPLVQSSGSLHTLSGHIRCHWHTHLTDHQVTLCIGSRQTTSPGAGTTHRQHRLRNHAASKSAALGVLRHQLTLVALVQRVGGLWGAAGLGVDLATCGHNVEAAVVCLIKGEVVHSWPALQEQSQQHVERQHCVWAQHNGILLVNLVGHARAYPSSAQHKYGLCATMTKTAAELECRCTCALMPACAVQAVWSALQPPVPDG